MSDVTRTTITFGRRRQPAPPGPVGGVLIAALALLVVAALIIAMFPESFHFDGMLGDGCDAGNSYCTYTEWRKGCAGDTDRLSECSFALYRAKGGR